MAVLALPLNNAYRHFNYIVFCPRTGEAASIDPFDAALVAEAATTRGLSITRIISTHEHWDHAGRNEQLRGMSGAKVLAHRSAAGAIEHLDQMLSTGETISFGDVSLTVAYTPGHTMTHISLCGREAGAPFALVGDTLFGAGVGNCGYGGHAPTLCKTISAHIRNWDPATVIYPGHDYLRRNLDFTLEMEPGNRAASALRNALDMNRDAPAGFTTIGQEKQINCFMRLEQPEIAETLRKKIEDLPEAPSPERIFLGLRALRDQWS